MRNIIRIVKKKILKMVAKNAPFYKLRIVLLRLCGYTIGKNVYIAEDLIISEALDDVNNLIIGDRVAIGPKVTLVTFSNPNFSKIRRYIGAKHGKIMIKDDAWIEAGAVILPDITIGNGAVVASLTMSMMTVETPANVQRVETENEKEKSRTGLR